jgi:integrase
VKVSGSGSPIVLTIRVKPSDVRLLREKLEDRRAVAIEGIARAQTIAGRPVDEREHDEHDLRHSAASLWLHEARTIIEVATWMGHSGQMALSTYLHMMSDLGDERISAEDAIRRARAALVPSSYPGEPQNDDEADAA